MKIQNPTGPLGGLSSLHSGHWPGNWGVRRGGGLCTLALAPAAVRPGGGSGHAARRILITVHIDMPLVCLDLQLFRLQLNPFLQV